MIRFFDILFSIIGLIFFSPFFFLIYFIAIFDTGSPLFFQERVGLNLKNFKLIKFRTMTVGTVSKGTHLIHPSRITFLGFYLRKFKIDEFPQLWNVLMGDMSFVGPRPSLSSQKKLIFQRSKRKILSVKPGITGLAQLKYITMKNPKLLVKNDLKMIKQLNLFYYFYYIIATVLLIFKKKL
jgi:O-antigen biosynthesis protein WbqP